MLKIKMCERKKITMINTVQTGDCIEVMKNMETKSVDMILCDLPYGMTNCKWDTIIPFEPLWEQYKRIVKRNGAVVLFGIEPFSSKLRLSNIKNYKYDWIWNKVKCTGFLNAKKQPLRNHETISVFYQRQCTYNPQKSCGHPKKKSYRKSIKTDIYNNAEKEILYESTERYPKSIQVFSADTQKSSLHPTQKPVKLLEFLIKTYTKENEIILDNCIGSGSTAIAAINTNRRWIGIEKDKKYVQVAENRIKHYKRNSSQFCKDIIQLSFCNL